MKGEKRRLQENHLFGEGLPTEACSRTYRKVRSAGFGSVCTDGVRSMTLHASTG